jgi:hypothetical protein
VLRGCYIGLVQLDASRKFLGGSFERFALHSTFIPGYDLRNNVETI